MIIVNFDVQDTISRKSTLVEFCCGEDLAFVLRLRFVDHGECNFLQEALLTIIQIAFATFASFDAVLLG